MKNNKSKFLLLIKNKFIKISEYYTLEESTGDEFLDIRLIEINYITDLSCMFDNCDSLYSIEDFAEFKMSRINNLGYLFNNCISFVSIDNISTGTLLI